ncbi:membrane integrity-associated transporter subunit PqiC [Erwinia sp. V71]|uniref:membrane integrity-associated transporter subunit PqiC n=1 Tax=Erwinia sp. V71 TaxID=3369424 RepID=UPI003F6446D3
MMKWIAVSAALVLSACSSTPETTYYQLPAGSGSLKASQPADAGSLAATRGAERRQPVLWVEHVAVPDYLAGNGVVYQTSDVKYVIAANNQWASPLDQQLQQRLVSNLSAALPGWIVSSSALGPDYDTLNVTVSGFHGRYDGQVIVSGEWILQHHQRLIKRPFLITLPQQEDGYDALVRTLAQGWQQEAQQIANALSRLE